MYNDKLMVHTSAAVDDGCEITHRVHDSDSAEVTCTYRHAIFVVDFSADGLREFVRHATTALAELDAIDDRENPEDEG